MPRPPLPEGIDSLREFGRLIGWGRGDDEARARIETVTRDELLALGFTSELAEVWEDFYLKVKMNNPQNPSAEGRAELMRHVAELLQGSW